VPVGDLWVLGVRALDPVTHQFLSADPLLPVPGSNGSASRMTVACAATLGLDIGGRQSPHHAGSRIGRG